MDIEQIMSNPRAYSNSRYIKMHWPEDYAQIINTEGDSFSEKLYRYIHHLTETPECKVCGAPARFISLVDGYSDYCSRKCAMKSPSRISRIRQTCMERYGVANPSQSESVKKKKQETCMEHYNVPNPLCMTDRKEAGMMKQYGVANPSQSESVKKKKQETCMEHYNVLYPAQAESIRKKQEETCMERYGVANPSQLPEIQERIRQTNIRKYGVANGSQMHIYDKFPDLVSVNGGVWTMKCPHPECTLCTERIYKTCSQIHNDRLRLGIETCTTRLPVHSSRSSYELQIGDWLGSQGIIPEYGNREVLNGKELDIYIPSHRLAIEINGGYWHSLKPPGYHTDKYIRCCDADIRLITVWTDWWDRDSGICKELILYHLGLGTCEEWEFGVLGPLNLVDLNLYPSDQIEPHSSYHDGFECWDAGMFIIQ